VEGVLSWLGGLPPAALYVILALVAATENFVPPIPADVIVAFGSFLAAR
jgi:membrane protein DedA with SNARE-associated domain